MAERSLNEQVRRKLHVTWSDPGTDARIDEEIVPTAEQDLRDLLGIPEGEEFDFSAPGTENLLFLNHCWYQWEGVSDDFETLYAKQIGRCRSKRMVMQYAEEQEPSDES